MEINKKQIENEEDMHMAMSAMRSAYQLLGTFDWKHLLDQAHFFEGTGATINPQIFMAMQQDPQWEQKKQLFFAVATFVSQIEDIQKQLEASHEK